MLPFFKIPTLLPGNPENGEGDKIAEYFIQPESIESFGPGYHFGTLVYMKSGQMHMLKMTSDEFEVGLNAYYKNVNDLMRRAQQGNGGIQLLQ